MAQARKEARQWTRGGIALFSVGVVTTFAVATPLWVARNNALDSASQARYRVGQLDDVAAARRRQTGAIVTFSIGAPIAALGIAMTTVGIVKHVKARRMTVTPTAGLHYGGATLTLRF